MKYFILYITIAIHYYSFSQTNYPNTLTIKSFEYLSKENIKTNYDFLRSDKKVFLFYDIASESMAEVMFNGCKFVFNKKNVVIFPIFYTGQLTKKSGENMENEIPVQVYRSPDMSPFKDFGLTEADFPLVVVYNDKNELCGVSKNVEGITDIDCGLEMVNLKVLRLKIMVEAAHKKLAPYADKNVIILGGKKNDTIAKLITNKYGDFNVELPDLDQDYLITVNEKNKNVNFVVLATQTGSVVGKFNSTDKGFEYRILKTELVKLPDIQIDDDIEMKFTNFKEKSLSNFSITETLYYELNQITLTSQAKELVDKIKNVLDTYPKYKLKVISHTDSQGDDNSNLALSIQRSENVVAYLISLGIKAERLSAEGKGETEIRNRCVNGIDCSDKEHEYNRRTEFRFYLGK